MSQMSATGSAYAEDGFRIGRVLGRSFGVLARHFIQFCLVTALPIAPIGYVLAFEVAPIAGNPHPDPATALRIGVLVLGTGAFWVVTQMIAQAVVLYGTFQDMRGKPVQLGESIGKGLAR